jgi:ElaB/YqjD/DUF883 family membrane-anchored ribosome-binding protein
MADIQSSTSTTAPRETSAPAQQEANRTEEQHNRMQETGKEIRQKAQEFTAQGKEVAAEYYQQGRERVLAWQQTLEQQAREKPLQSLMIAAGIGLLLGLLRRR